MPVTDQQWQQMVDRVQALEGQVQTLNSRDARIKERLDTLQARYRLFVHDMMAMATNGKLPKRLASRLREHRERAVSEND